MRQTLRLGRIAGIPLGVHWSVLVIMVLLTEGLANNVLPATAPGWSTPGWPWPGSRKRTPSPGRSPAPAPW